MVDSNPPADAAAPPADDAAAALAKLHLDEVTGEMISKTELKKRQKARERDAQKKEKQAAKPAPEASNTKSAEAREDELTPNQVCAALLVPELTLCQASELRGVLTARHTKQYFEIRSKTVNELHAQGKAYPHKVRMRQSPPRSCARFATGEKGRGGGGGCATAIRATRS